MKKMPLWICKCLKMHFIAVTDIHVTTLVRNWVCSTITLQLKCKNCNFVSHELPLFHSVKKPRDRQTTGILNSCLVLPVLGSQLGISDIQLILACLNIQAPDKRGLQRKFNSRTEYFQYRRTTRYSKRRQIANKERFKHSIYKSPTVASVDHSYGINLG